VFEIAIVEHLTGYSMPKEDPSDDLSAGVKWRNGFRAEHIEGTAHNGALSWILGLMEIGARNQMSIDLKPANQRVPLLKYKLIGFGETVNPAAEAVRFTFAALRKDSQPTDTGGFGYSLSH
jgi:hypothetical protein